MPLVVSRQIRQAEFGAKIPPADLAALLRSTRVALATRIAAKGTPRGTRLLKGYATTPRGPRRVVYLLAVEDGTLFLLFYRGKNDPVGENISPKNPVFTRQLEKHLDLLQADLSGKKFDVIETE
jgi:hypothetical protein